MARSVRVAAFSIVHGSVYDEDEYVFSPALAVDGLLNAPSPVVFFGHTHIQGGFTLRGENVQVVAFKPEGGSRFAPLTVEDDTQYLLNPGSIGQPRDGDTRAGFAIADLENQSVEFWRVPYDIEDVQGRMARAGLPGPLIQRLSIGH